MSKPTFITFTGLDEQTDLAAAMHLAKDYPVEYGILFSPERQGADPRYPSWGALNRLLPWIMPGQRFAAHLCGDYSRQLLAAAETDIDDVLRDRFSRVQINTAQRGIDTLAVAQWGETVGVQAILQCREEFPSDLHVSWLFDASGGRGISPPAWPRPPVRLAYDDPPMLGYAGGIGPENVEAAVAAIGQHDQCYWIDMESGVRTNNRFDLAKCRAVCEAVYGPRKG